MREVVGQDAAELSERGPPARLRIGTQTPIHVDEDDVGSSVSPAFAAGRAKHGRAMSRSRGCRANNVMRHARLARWF